MFVYFLLILCLGGDQFDFLNTPDQLLSSSTAAELNISESISLENDNRIDNNIDGQNYEIPYTFDSKTSSESNKIVNNY